MTVAWINSQNARKGLELKQVTVEGGPTEQVIHITGGLPELPLGPTDGPLIMPTRITHNGHAMDGHALAAPAPAVPDPEPAANESTPEETV
jgi:hypothetical protein